MGGGGEREGGDLGGGGARGARRVRCLGNDSRSNG